MYYICSIMSKPIYLNKMKIESDLDKINKVVSIFSIIKNGNLGYCHIRPRCVQVISYYILFGYSRETRELIQSLGIKLKNLNQINSELTKKGYLVKDDKNFHNKHLSNELKKIKDYFMNTEIKNKLFLIELLDNE